MSRLMRARLRHGNRISRRSARASHMARPDSGGFENAEDRRRVLAPRVRLGAQLLATASGEAVELRLAIVLAHAPLRFDRPVPLQPVKRLVQRRVLDLEHAARALLYVARDA